jgi:hypothetical protein
MPYTILFTDLDGTLLDSRGQISEADRAAVAVATEGGKRVVLCSGRSWRSLAMYESRLGLDKPGCCGVSFNGGVVYAYGGEKGERQFLLRQPLDNALGKEIIHALRNSGGGLVLYAGDDLYAEEEIPSVRWYSGFTGIPLHIVDNFDNITESFVKILLRGPNGILREAENEIKNRFPRGLFNIFFSSGELLEICPPNGHKGYGVKFLADYLNIPMQSVIAMGDEGNDVTMIESAGLGIAVANAVPAVKKAAKVVLDRGNDQSALCHAVHTYLLRR